MLADVAVGIATGIILAVAVTIATILRQSKHKKVRQGLSTRGTANAVKVQCPHCSNQMTVAGAFISKPVMCTACNRQFIAEPLPQNAANGARAKHVSLGKEILKVLPGPVVPILVLLWASCFDRVPDSFFTFGLPLAGLGMLWFLIAPFLAVRNIAADRCPKCGKRQMFRGNDGGLLLTCDHCGRSWMAGTFPYKHSS